MLYRIADDLERHDWYLRLVEETIADVEAFAARWAAFEELVFSQDAADLDDL